MKQDERRFLRQTIAFGKEGQEKIASTKVAIVGLGGIGSQVAQLLSFLGVRSFMLIDHDRAEHSNLNRLIGAQRGDADNGRKKVEIAAHLIQQVDSNASVIQIGNELRSEESIRGLIEYPEIIFGCVDNDAARLILTEISAAYEKTLVDSATEISAENERTTEFGGRVVVARPGDFCLFCAHQLDAEVARLELESEAERDFRNQHGYGLGPQAPNPAVVTLNAVIAGLATTEFMSLVTGVREPVRMLTFKGMRGIVTASIDVRRNDCPTCNQSVGQRDAADLFRFVRREPPIDLSPR